MIHSQDAHMHILPRPVLCKAKPLVPQLHSLDWRPPEHFRSSPAELLYGAHAASPAARPAAHCPAAAVTCAAAAVLHCRPLIAAAASPRGSLALTDGAGTLAAPVHLRQSKSTVQRHGTVRMQRTEVHSIDVLKQAHRLCKPQSLSSSSQAHQAYTIAPASHRHSEPLACAICNGVPASRTDTPTCWRQLQCRTVPPAGCSSHHC